MGIRCNDDYCKLAQSHQLFLAVILDQSLLANKRVLVLVEVAAVQYITQCNVSLNLLSLRRTRAALLFHADSGLANLFQPHPKP